MNACCSPKWRYTFKICRLLIVGNSVRVAIVLLILALMVSTDCIWVLVVIDAIDIPLVNAGLSVYLGICLGIMNATCGSAFFALSMAHNITLITMIVGRRPRLDVYLDLMSIDQPTELRSCISSGERPRAAFSSWSCNP
jgi:hypothetical protein